MLRSARLVLLSENSIQFFEVEEPSDTPGFMNKNQSTAGLFFQKISNMVTSDLKDQLPIIMEEYLLLLSDTAFLTFIENIPSK